MKKIQSQLEAAKVASGVIKDIKVTQKTRILVSLADVLEKSRERIMSENQKDLERMSPEDPKYDRLALTEERISDLIGSLQSIAQLADPSGQVLSSKELDNGLLIQKMSVPMGVVGIVYESRPNVTVDVAALCIRSGNACLLRGGSDAWYTNSILVRLIQDVLESESLSPHIIQLLPTDRDCVMELLHADKYVDVVIPRGSHSLIEFVREHAKIPVIETGAGVCHTYVEASADLTKAVQIVENAKVSRPSVCNALDTVLVDQEIAQSFIKKLGPLLQDSGVKIFADPKAYDEFSTVNYNNLHLADEDDFGREFLSLSCSFKIVEGMEEALSHIAIHSSKHSECIVSADKNKIEQFLNDVDAAAVYANASTRFTDGGEFGLGAEIGISTQKLHARGPFALEKLVTEKWIIRGDGQIR